MWHDEYKKFVKRDKERWGYAEVSGFFKKCLKPAVTEILLEKTLDFFSGFKLRHYHGPYIPEEQLLVFDALKPLSTMVIVLECGHKISKNWLTIDSFNFFERLLKNHIFISCPHCEDRPTVKFQDFCLEPSGKFEP